jgi:hypothetical protein
VKRPTFRSLGLTILLVSSTLLAGPSTTASAAAGCAASMYYGQSAYTTALPGQSLVVVAAFLNSGSCGWVVGSASQVNLATCCPVGIVSPLLSWGPTWLSARAYATASTSFVGPGQIGWFAYGLTVPLNTAPGNYFFYGELALASTGAALNPQGYFHKVTVVALSGGGSSVAGTVTDPSGAAIANTTVDLIPSGCMTCAPAATTQTNAQGTYLAPVPPGSYKVRFDTFGFVAQFYNGKVDFASGDLVTVASGAAVTGINATLRPYPIRGRVTSAATSAAIPNASVQVNSDTSPTIITSTLTDGQGRYQIDLPNGSYRVHFVPPAGSNYFEEWWDNHMLTWDAAKTVTTSSASPQVLDAALSNAYAVTGTLQTSTLVPVAGAWAMAFDASAGAIARCGSSGCMYTGFAISTASGSYSIPVPSGTFRLEFLPFGATAGAEWSGNADSFSTATPVTVSGANISVPFVFRPAISGTVSSAASPGTKIANVSVLVHDMTAQCALVRSAPMLTDANGWYGVPMPVGTYRVHFSPTIGLPYSDRWSGNAGDCTSATPITVTTPAGAPNTNAALLP